MVHGWGFAELSLEVRMLPKHKVNLNDPYVLCRNNCTRGGPAGGAGSPAQMITPVVLSLLIKKKGDRCHGTVRG